MQFITNTDTTCEVLHPYYKLAYIKHAWGGPEEQAAEIAAGNPDAKDWQDKARQIVEKTVSLFSSFVIGNPDGIHLDGMLLCNSPSPFSTTE
jgi:hypothetical protein